MRKLTLLLAIAAIAAAPSLATAKTTAKAHHAKAPKAKVMKVAEYKDPNINTWRLFGLVRDDKPAPKAKKK
jgi:hypothetical protein